VISKTLTFIRSSLFGLDCGDVSDVTNNNGVFGDESECSTPCPGDSTTICGAGNRLTTYYWNGVINDWKTPNNIGRYEVCQLVSMLAAI
jgi:hypothetical protein